MLKSFALLSLLGLAAAAAANLEWVSFNGQRYHQNSNKLAWYDAHDFCLDHGAQLASIHSAAEQTFVASLVNTTNEWAWIGGFRVTAKDAFRWTDESAFDYSNWKSPKYPLATPNFDCLDITHNGPDHSGAPLNNAWTNYECSKLAASICKKQ